MQNVFTLIYSVILGLGLYLFSLKGKIELLKKISMLGIFFVFYLLIVFLILLPSYYSHFKNQIHFVGWNFDKNFFVTSGICIYLFLNQYSVIPICNNLQDLSASRIYKIIGRTDIICMFLYISTILIGFYSMPNDIVGTKEEKLWQLFPNRPNINGFNFFVFLGQFLFGLNLLIAVFVKAYFLIMYFNQILQNFAVLFSRQEKIKKIQIEKRKSMEHATLE